MTFISTLKLVRLRRKKFAYKMLPTKDNVVAETTLNEDVDHGGAQSASEAPEYPLWSRQT